MIDLPLRDKRGSGALALCVLAALPVFTGTALAQEQGFYVGVPVMVERLSVLYDKAVDNTDPRNVSPSRGQVYRSESSAAGATAGAGFLAGYRVPFGASGVYLSGEFDLVAHGGAVRGRLEGAGFSPERVQLGENWPEDWTFRQERSYGFTVRVGGGIPGGSNLSLYALAGLRRLDANFGVDYAGCYSHALCTADQLTPAADSYEENLTGWTAGAGVEQRLGGSVGIRGELRYTRYGSAERVIPYDDLAINVPLAVKADGVGAQFGLIWYF